MSSGVQQGKVKQVVKISGEEIWKTKMEKIVSFTMRLAEGRCMLARDRCQPTSQLTIFTHSLPNKNSELFSLTYGSLVLQLFKDCENWTEVNKQLDTM